MNTVWINFLRKYGPIPQNDNMYDETIQRYVKQKGIRPIQIEAQYLNALIENFKTENPRSVILTGTAGDGKTYHCREVWFQLNGTFDQWEKSGNIKEISIDNGRTLYVIKDLSELSDEEKRHILFIFIRTIKGLQNNSIFLIAANDGQLMEALKFVEVNDVATGVYEDIEEMLVSDLREHSGYSLTMINLSRISAAWALPRVIEAITTHEGWASCDQCIYRDNVDAELRCPIWENKKRLEGHDGNETLRQRLGNLLELCEINGIHLPIRQLLLLVSNMILGHPDAKDRLLRCRDIPNILEARSTSKASIYRNVFGENLPEHRKETRDIFNTLGRFGVGSETSNRVDSILIFGEDDPELNHLYQSLVLSDNYYGADHAFRAEQRKYLEGISEDGGASFLDLVRAQRQRLFFSIPEEKAEDLRLWELTTFHYAGEFLSKVYRIIEQGGRPHPQILSRIVKGLNRISTGLLTKTTDKLILATSGSNSQSRVSKIFEGNISVARDRGESVQIKGDDLGRINLEVSLSTSPTVPVVKLHLQLIRYEFLSRVAEGALPGSFSRECYEDILAFKSRLMNAQAKRNKEYQEDDYLEDALSFYILVINSDGVLDKKTVEVLN
ncbi:hypothetical protein ACFFNY_30240 [Paenibacillus hodogayensis]|uniref:ATP-binding protein n=1 Tax=Paenibacillus hodogayensis TaxID=279208 RepID=A0ABV5W5N0_9BACL